ncbi:MAG TPA: hypothetical protein VNN22_04285, partial [Verrucomicrobiae bacterium]|nr:hypothetical protein [Verrucomicrobiae bacterium]
VWIQRCFMNESRYWPLMIPSRGMKRPQRVDKIEANSFRSLPAALWGSYSTLAKPLRFDPAKYAFIFPRELGKPPAVCRTEIESRAV